MARSVVAARHASITTLDITDAAGDAGSLEAQLEDRLGSSLAQGSVALDLKRLKLRSLPAALFERFSALRDLSLRQNLLATLPGDFCVGLPLLRRLDIADNQLEALPDHLDVLTALEALDASNNRIARLPKTIYGIATLRHLTLDDNRLTRLDAALTQLGHLETLSVQRNELVFVADNIGLMALRKLFLSGNDPALRLTRDMQAYQRRHDLIRDASERRALVMRFGGFRAHLRDEFRDRWLAQLPQCEQVAGLTPWRQG